MIDIVVPIVSTIFITIATIIASIHCVAIKRFIKKHDFYVNGNKVDIDVKCKNTEVDKITSSLSKLTPSQLNELFEKVKGDTKNG